MNRQEEHAIVETAFDVLLELVNETKLRGVPEYKQVLEQLSYDRDCLEREIDKYGIFY